MLGRNGVFVLTTIALLCASPECSGEQSGTIDGKAVLQQFCMDCHDSSAAEGDFVLPLESPSWNEDGVIESLELVHTMIDKKIMPPVEMDQPSEAERLAMLQWLD